MPLSEKIKEYLNQNQKRLIIATAFLAIGFIGFGLGIVTGRLSYQEPIEIEYTNVSNLFAKESGIKKFIASKQGEYYYPEDCSSASILKRENIIEFLSVQQAEEFGYKKSDKCNY